MRVLVPGTVQYNHYRNMRLNQTVEYVRKQRKNWFKFDKGNFSIRQVFDLLEEFVDQSDPDLELPNKYHMFQAAEAARASGQPEWMILVSLIHDLGKIMCVWGSNSDGQGNQDQWGCVGDTFVVGCDLPEKLLAPELNAINPDTLDSRFQGDGIYKRKCGLDNLMMAFGHDEYLYHVLSNHTDCRIPKQGLDAVRYHSCYALHSSNAYDRFLVDSDNISLSTTKSLNRFDLYSKSDKTPDLEHLWPFYDDLISKLCPGSLHW